MGNEIRGARAIVNRNHSCLFQLSTLLAVPDNPKETMLYLLKGFVTIDWNSSQTLFDALGLLGAYSQEKYLYHFSGGTHLKNIVIP